MSRGRGRPKAKVRDWREGFVAQGLIPPPGTPGTAKPAQPAIDFRMLREHSNDELHDIVVGLCSKIAVDDESGLVNTVDLVELRDGINEIRNRVSKGEGYKAFPWLVRPGQENST
jgi:hypothetical protein